MAQNEVKILSRGLWKRLLMNSQVFAGPISESLASSISSFQHRRRSRADSNVSFSFYQPERGDDQENLWEDEREGSVFFADDNQSEYTPSEVDREISESAPLHRMTSYRSESTEDPLLEHRNSTAFDRDSLRTTQKIYIETEDLTIVVAGFTTSRLKYGLYLAICVLTLGIGWLLLRWFPRWRIQLVGKPATLRECNWVVVENQWNEFSVQDIQICHYGQSLSTIFGIHEKSPEAAFDLDEDDDPVIPSLRCLDYRYIRFVYHPLHDKFLLNNGWKDPNWTDVKVVRSGIDMNEKEHRNLVFGANVIDIEEKSIMQLLIDEVRQYPLSRIVLVDYVMWIYGGVLKLTCEPIGFPPLLRVSNSQFGSLVN